MTVRTASSAIVNEAAILAGTAMSWSRRAGARSKRGRRRSGGGLPKCPVLSILRIVAIRADDTGVTHGYRPPHLRSGNAGKPGLRRARGPVGVADDEHHLRPAS